MSVTRAVAEGTRLTVVLVALSCELADEVRFPHLARARNEQRRLSRRFLPSVDLVERFPFEHARLLS